MQKIKYILFPIFSLFMISVNAQLLDHKLGEVIVNVESEKDIINLVSEFKSFNNRATSVEFTKICDLPTRLYVLKFDWKTINENDILEKISLNSKVLSAQKNKLITARKTPNDPRFTNQWQYINIGSTGGVGNDLDMDEAWDIATGGITAQGDTIVVAIIDDGFDQSHEDLAPNVWRNHKEIPNNGIDDDNNGYIDDYNGWSVTKQIDQFDIGSHGLAVCGIVGAKGNNNLGVSGMNWDVKIMHIEYGTGTEANALASYGYAYKMRSLYNESNGQKGAFVIATNASWGINEGKAEDAPIWCGFYDALGKIGVINCGATANKDLDVEISGDLPTSCTSDFLISVTNLNSNDMKVNSAAYGSRSIDLAAYGEGTYTLSGNNNYGTFGGTSGSTPHVAGLSALIYSTACTEFIDLAKSNPELAALATKDFILNGVKPLSVLNEITTARGKLNGKNSMKQVKSLCENTTVPYAFQIKKITNDLMRASWLGGDNTQIDIRYRTAGTGSWTTKLNVSNPYNIANLPLCNDYEFQFKSTYNNIWGYSRFLKTSGCCELPQQVELSSFNNSIIIEYNSDINTTESVIEYRRAGMNNWIIEETSDDIYTSLPLEFCSTYEVRIKSKCQDTNNESNYSPIYLVSTDCESCTDISYCNLAPKNNEYEWIESFTLDGITNNSGKNSLAYGFYADFFDFDLIQNTTYDISLLPGYATTAYPEYFKIFIDFNHDGLFDNTAEIVFDAGTTTKISIEGQITIPQNATQGYTRMRVIMSYQKAANPCEPNNGDFEDGEYEDYCVYISDGQCARVNKIVVDNVKLDGFNLTWENVGASSYTIKVKDLTSGNILEFNTSNTVFTIDGLKECNQYSLFLESICGNIASGMGDLHYIFTKCGSFTNDSEISNFNISSVYFSYEYLKIKYESSENIELNTKVIDLSGKILYSNLSNWNSGGQVQTFKLPSSLITGVYLVNFSNSSLNKTVKIMKY